MLSRALRNTEDCRTGLVGQILVGFRFRFPPREFSEPNPTRPTHIPVLSEPNPTRILNHDEPALNLQNRMQKLRGP